jgi:hypothetical protein
MGVAPFSWEEKMDEREAESINGSEEGSDGTSGSARGSAIGCLASLGVLYKNWFIVPGDRGQMQPYAIEPRSKKRLWFAIRSVAKPAFIQSRSCYGLCAGEGCLWLHGGVTRSMEVHSALFKIEVVPLGSRVS